MWRTTREFVNRTRVHQDTTHIHERRSPIREDRVASAHSNGTSGKRQEIDGIGILPVIPELVDHLGETVCQKIGLLALIRRTAWCIINKGSIEMSES